MVRSTTPPTRTDVIWVQDDGPGKPDRVKVYVKFTLPPPEHFDWLQIGKAV